MRATAGSSLPRSVGRAVARAAMPLALAAGSLLASARPSLAQSAVAQACLARLVDADLPTDAYGRLRHPALILDSLAPLESAGEWEKSMARIQRLFREDARFFPDTARLAPLYGRVRDAVDRFAAALPRSLADESSAGVDSATLFTVQELPSGEGFTILDSRLIPAESPIAQARSLCWLGHTMKRFHERLTLQARQSSERALRQRVARWDAFNERGLTPYPWELALNEAVRWFGSRAPLEPPRLQLIALRPGAAIETDSRLDGRVSAVIVEAAGLVLYPASRDWYLSLSGTWISPSEAKAGYGVMLRVAPWLMTAGIAWRDADGDGRRERRLLLSLDAYDLLRDAPARLRAAAAQATGGLTNP